jgi:translation initiation factor eIF-2B subunit alpha
METEAPSMENPKISAYYQTRLAHFGVVSTEWLAQAQSATKPLPSSSTDSDTDKDTNFSVIDEFNRWRNHPDLAEAVAAIRALAAVISSSKASTMMQLEIELKNASDTLKVCIFIIFLFLLI